MWCLTAKNVPGRKTIVKSAMERMCFDSRLVDSAISTLVSPCACFRSVFFSSDGIVRVWEWRRREKLPIA